MAKRRRTKRETRGGGEAAPKTVGELRKLLARLGTPWEPDPRLSDDEPIPRFPMGGDASVSPVGRPLPQGKAIDAIRRDPPLNPHLREIWLAQGLLRRTESARSTAKTKARRPSGQG
jgi:hypothetical protein